MMRQTIDEYLDGVLDAQGRAAVEQAVASDAVAKSLLEKVRAERAVRSAVYDSYMPAKAEASALASQILAACEDEAAAPIGRIGMKPWVRWTAGIAAGLLVLIGTFAAGRMSAPDTKGVDVANGNNQPAERAMVAILDPNDEAVIREVHEYASFETAKDFIQNYGQRQNARTMVASLELPEAGWR